MTNLIFLKTETLIEHTWLAQSGYTVVYGLDTTKGPPKVPELYYWCLVPLDLPSLNNRLIFLSCSLNE